MEIEDAEVMSNIISPGALVTSDMTFMKGHGTFMENDKIYSAVTGNVERINRLISVRGIKHRFVGEIGDTIVGRITRIGPKRWMVDVNSRQDAVLLLSSVNLPGGIQRRKSESDELQMRSFFQEGDMVFAEVQSAFSDGALSLHTRSLEYGKLKNGSLVKVRPNLIVRSRNHLLHLPCGVDVVLGVNGYIWVMKHVSKERLEETSELMYSNKNENISLSDRENISRICNSIVLLDRLFVKINDTSILYAYDCGLNYQPRELITYEVASLIAEQVKSKLQSH